MLLAALVTLAQSDDDRMLSLADAVQQWCGYSLAKDAVSDILMLIPNHTEKSYYHHFICDDKLFFSTL